MSLGPVGQTTVAEIHWSEERVRLKAEIIRFIESHPLFLEPNRVVG